MRRATAIVFVLLAAGAVGLVAARRSSSSPDLDHRPGSARARAGTRDLRTTGPERSADEGLAAAGEPLPAAADEPTSDAGGVLFDGGTVPELLAERPKSVTFGVVLVQYADAEGAAPGTRSYDEARKLARELAAVAKEDFGAAVDRGDPGSTKNAGKMFRGVLEPAPEYVLFSLDKDEVSDPVDTPKGFWIVRRIE